MVCVTSDREGAGALPAVSSRAAAAAAAATSGQRRRRALPLASPPPAPAAVHEEESGSMGEGRRRRKGSSAGMRAAGLLAAVGACSLLVAATVTAPAAVVLVGAFQPPSAPSVARQRAAPAPTSAAGAIQGRGLNSPLWGRQQRQQGQGQGRRGGLLTRLRSVMPEAPPAAGAAAAAAAAAAAPGGRRKKKGGQGEGGDPWEGHKHGFDWQLERARRTLEGPAFAPFRMDYWKPPAEGGDPAVERRVGLTDSLKIMVTNAYQLLTGSRGLDGAPVADVGKYNGSWTTFLSKVMSGQLEELAGGPLFLLLAKYYQKHGPVYKLMFGPRSFMVVSDPVMVKHILKTNAQKYDKGVLAEILEPIMGKGLIPADQVTWKTRRRAIVPGFHSKWLNRMVRLFSECAQVLVDKLEAEGQARAVVDMETLFCSVSLDIIGKAVFNYDFGSVTQESPVIKSVYSTLREAEHRSMSFVPYWKIPFADRLLPDQVAFKANMRLLNEVLDALIAQAVASAEKADLEDLTSGRDYDAAEDASLLRFLVDMRGEETSSRQLRDDLMTMLIAGHETSAAVLTWTLFELSRRPEVLARVQEEVDGVLGDRIPTYDDLKSLVNVRLALIEALRLYPEPPILIRRALEEDHLPQGGSGVDGGIRLLKGTDVFISTWSLHRSPELWEAPNEFRPERWLRPMQNPGVQGWAGYDPSHMSGLYPNEVATDFSFLPFGGGARKCIGDQFAIMETTVIMAMLLRRFDFALASTPEEVGMRTGATIHTENGLRMTVTPRVNRPPTPPAPAPASVADEHQPQPVGVGVVGGSGGCPMHAQ